MGRCPPDVLFTNPPSVATGEYADRECSDDRLWAAAELWRTTKDAKYSAYFSAHYAPFLDHLKPTGPPMWSNNAPMALWSYALGHGPDAEARAAITSRIAPRPTRSPIGRCTRRIATA